MMTRRPDPRFHRSPDGDRLLIIAAVIILSSLAGTVWVFFARGKLIANRPPPPAARTQDATAPPQNPVPPVRQP